MKTSRQANKAREAAQNRRIARLVAELDRAWALVAEQQNEQRVAESHNLLTGGHLTKIIRVETGASIVEVVPGSMWSNLARTAICIRPGGEVLIKGGSGTTSLFLTIEHEKPKDT